jgi:DNA modification methylase
MNRCIVGNCLDVLPTLDAGSVQCCVTSPPYWGLRDYGNAAQLGLEKTPEEYVAKMVAVFREVKRVLRDDGTLWLNLGDSYVAPNGRSGGGTYGRGPNSQMAHMHEAQEIGVVKSWGYLPAKNLVGIPWRVAFALQADGWYLRQDIIWHKPNPMPESVTDRCTKAHEYIFLLSKSERYYFDSKAIAEICSTHDDNVRDRESTRLNNTPGRTRMGGLTTNDYETRNKRSVWTVTTKPFSGAHFATFPPDLIEPCILAGSKPNDVVLDPFGGSGTTGMVAENLGRRWLLIELNPEYEKLSRERTAQKGMVYT